MLYIKLENQIATSYFYPNLTDTKGNRPPEYDIFVREYPKDFKQDIKKYIISGDQEPYTFTMRERYDEYQDYLDTFDYGLEGENTPDSYEDWIN